MKRKYMIIENEQTKYAIDILKTQEIICTQSLTRVPLSSPCMLGLTSVRDVLYSIYDISLLLGGDKIDTETNETYIILMERYNNNKFGILISGTVEMKDIDDTDIKSVDIGIDTDKVAHVENEIYVVLKYDYLINKIFNTNDRLEVI